MGLVEKLCIRVQKMGKLVRALPRRGYTSRRTRSGGKYRRPGPGSLIGQGLIGAWKLRNRIRTRERIALRSRTKTSQRVINDGGPGTESKYWYGKGRLSRSVRELFKLASPDFYVCNLSGQLTATSGRQDFTTPIQMYNQADLDTINTKVETQLSIAAANKTTRVMHLGCTAEVVFTNMDVAPTRVVLYDIVARRDLSVADLADPVASFGPGLTGEEAANSTAYQIIGFNPFSVQNFTKNFKVLKKTYLMLQGGQVHTHRVSFQPNKQVNEVLLRNIAYGLKGLTCFTMLQAYGTPCNSAAVTTTVSTTPVKLNIIVKKQYRYSFIQDATTNYGHTNVLSVLADPRIMGIADGDAQNDSQA